MIRIIKIEQLKTLGARKEMIDWFDKCKGQGFYSLDYLKELLKPEEMVKIAKKYRIHDKYDNECSFDWANWILIRLMEYDEYLRYAIYMVNQVEQIYVDEQNDSFVKDALEIANEYLNAKNNKVKEKASNLSGRFHDLKFSREPMGIAALYSASASMSLLRIVCSSVYAFSSTLEEVDKVFVETIKAYSYHDVGMLHSTMIADLYDPVLEKGSGLQKKLEFATCGFKMIVDEIHQK